MKRAGKKENRATGEYEGMKMRLSEGEAFDDGGRLVANNVAQWNNTVTGVT